MHTYTISTSTHCHVWQSCADLLPADGCVEGCPAILVLLIHAGPMLNEEGEGLHVPVGGSNVHLMVRRASQHWLRCSTHAHTEFPKNEHTASAKSHKNKLHLLQVCMYLCISVCVCICVHKAGWGHSLQPTHSCGPIFVLDVKGAVALDRVLEVRQE